MFGSTEFSVTLPAKQGDLYFEVESYYWGILRPKCHPLTGQPPYLSLEVRQNGNSIFQSSDYALYSSLVLVYEADYEAGDEFTINVAW